VNERSRSLIIIAITILAAIVQVTVAGDFGIKGIWPNLILILAVQLAFFGQEKEAYLAAALGGIILDLASPWFFGINLIILLLIVSLVRLLVYKLINEPTVSISIIVAAASNVLFDLITLVLVHKFSLQLIAINLIYSSFVAICFYQFLKHLLKNQLTVKIQ